MTDQTWTAVEAYFEGELIGNDAILEASARVASRPRLRIRFRDGDIAVRSRYRHEDGVPVIQRRDREATQADFNSFTARHA